MDRLVEALVPYAHHYLSEQAIRDTVEAAVDKPGLWEALKPGMHVYGRDFVLRCHWQCIIIVTVHVGP